MTINSQTTYSVCEEIVLSHGQILKKIVVNTIVFMFQYSWKLLHPTDQHQNKDCPADAEEYERVRRQAWIDLYFT